jgi:hypothetical protein
MSGNQNEMDEETRENGEATALGSEGTGRCYGGDQGDESGYVSRAEGGTTEKRGVMARKAPVGGHPKGPREPNGAHPGALRWRTAGQDGGGMTAPGHRATAA